MAFDDGGFVDDFGPPYPPPLYKRFLFWAENYRSTYQGIMDALDLSVDDFEAVGCPTLTEVNNARLAHDVEYAAAVPVGSPVSDPDGLMLVIVEPVMPTTNVAGSSLDLTEDCILVNRDDPDQWQAAPTMTDPTGQLDLLRRLRRKAQVLTNGYTLWQMYGTAVALMLARIGSFHQHGGRPHQ